MNIENLIVDNQRKKGNDDSELRMHKILYFLYGFYWKEYKEELFVADFRAWKYGPIELDYRISLKNNSTSRLSKLDLIGNNCEIKEERINKILEHPIYKRFFNFSAGKLIQYSHVTDPWWNVMTDQTTNSNKINVSKIKTFFEETNNFEKWNDWYVEKRKLDLFTKRAGLIDKVD